MKRVASDIQSRILLIVKPLVSVAKSRIEDEGPGNSVLNRP